MRSPMSYTLPGDHTPTTGAHKRCTHRHGKIMQTPTAHWTCCGKRAGIMTSEAMLERGLNIVGLTGRKKRRKEAIA